MAERSGAVLWNPESAGPATASQSLPSAQLEPGSRSLRRRKQQASSRRRCCRSRPADVLAAVDAPTAAHTKAAYRSEWARFTLWAGAGNVPSLPAPH